MYYRICFIVIVLSIAFGACKKNDPINPNSYRLKGFEKTGGDSMGYIYLSYTYFTYNSQNLITDVVDSNNRGYGLKTSIEYNLQNKPIKFTWFPLIGIPSQIDTVIYNSNQQFIKRIKGNYYYSPYFLTNQYAYDQKGRLSADSTYAYAYVNNDNVLVLTGYTEFNYDAYDNILYTRHFGNIGGIMKEYGRTDFTYDNNINPFNNLGWLAYFNRTSGYVSIFGEYYLPSKNNVLTIKYKNNNFPQGDYTRTFNYQYENNRIKKILVDEKSANNDYTSTVSLFYE